MNTWPLPHTFFSTIKYTLLVSLICYLPYGVIAPWWLLLFILVLMAYRLTSDYYGIRRLPKSLQLILIIGILVLLKVHYGSIVSSNFYIGFLLAFVGLKITEIHSVRDIRVLILCNFYLIFSALIVIQELWIIVYLMIAILANLSLMLKITAPEASLRQIGSKSFKLLVIAIPLSVLLFYIFPRIANPLWQVPSQTQGKMGFSEQMAPGSIARLFKDDSTAFRVTFKNKPILNGYWRGLLLSFYNGINWSAGSSEFNGFLPLPPLNVNSLADYEILLEPHQHKWLFYTGYPLSSTPSLLFSSSYGLVNQNRIISQRFTYAIQLQTPSYRPLNDKEWRQNTQLPLNFNPQLNAWAKQQYAMLHHDSKAFISYLQNYINQESFWYSLSPPELQSKNQMDSFWFDTKKGYCEHYASAVTVILRSVGIPARVVVGYQGGEWNPLAHYLNIQQNSAHAWLEYWLDGRGWQQFDPTSFIARARIEEAILEQQNERLAQVNYTGEGRLSWWERSRLLFDSARFFAERWLLFYNQDTQNNLLHILGLTQWDRGALLQAAMGCVILFFIFVGLFYQRKSQRSRDPLLIEYHLLQREFRRFNVVTLPSATLKQQCHTLMNQVPSLQEQVKLFLSCYEQLRLQQSNGSAKENHKKTVHLFKAFRGVLKKYRPK